jgi:hypothetical protein
VALDYAVALSTSLRAELCLVHVLPKIADPEWARPLHCNPDDLNLLLSEYERALYACAPRKLHEVMQRRLPEETRARAIVKVGETGSRCSNCSSLMLNGEDVCRYCGAGLHAVKDLLARAARRVVAMGGAVEQVRGDAARQLREAGGIGAFLR